MAVIEWRPELGLGIPEIDEEHLLWVAAINLLGDSIVKHQDKLVILRLAKTSVDYAARHFADEEMLFLSTNYPDGLQHRAQHAAFLSTLRGAYSALEKDSSEKCAGEFIRLLTEWLVAHVEGVDQKYVSYVMEKKRNAPSTL